MAVEPPGTVTIANDVLQDIAGYVALECYGVVGMASPSLRDGVAQLLSRDKLRKGVVIANTDERSVLVDLYVIIEHGTNLTQVSRNLSDRVRYALTHDADVVVTEVNVHVQGIKVRKHPERA
ncbi:MAG: Asp23/Gls24 family envelope stress response protein [Coriobacteriia bacterium]|nr:Asp23/Gls24 family envelope stress response protein [Coriobacteriia bacterium]